MGREWLVVWTIIAAFSSHFHSQEIVLKYCQWFWFNSIQSKNEGWSETGKSNSGKDGLSFHFEGFFSISLIDEDDSREIFIQSWKFVRTVCGSYDSKYRISLFI